MRWIVGLGNPGQTYAHTRHNIGWMALEQLATQEGVTFGSSKLQGTLGVGTISGVQVALIKPTTYMNLSGACVQAMKHYYKWQDDDLIVLYDDLDTPLGNIRLRLQGGHGGHNGMRSIIDHLGKQTFPRIRMGISRPPAGHSFAEYVLAPFPVAQEELRQQTIAKTCEALKEALTTPFERVMAQWNAR